MDVDLLLPLENGAGLGTALQESLRRAIRSGILHPGTKLPSSRALAAQLGIARGTVVDAYRQLAAEGWLDTRPASGTIVAGPPGTREPQAEPEPPTVDGGACSDTALWERPQQAIPGPPHAVQYDLRPGRGAIGSFPYLVWIAAARAAVNRAAAPVWSYPDPYGNRTLREALVEHLRRSRGVQVADPDQVVVRAGFTDALGLVLDLLPPGSPVAAETTIAAPLRAVIERAGHPSLPLPVDSHGAMVHELDALTPPPAAVVVTPGHQFPVGATLQPRRRQALCRWARRNDAFVVENDYDGEFWYDGPAVGALQGLDPDRVVYGGSVSLTLAPTLRLGWLVLPPRLADRMRSRGLQPELNPVPVLSQLTLAELLSSGEYSRHVRRMRHRYRQRRDELVAALAPRAPRVTVLGAHAGLHLVLRLAASVDERSVIDACARHGVAVAGLTTGPTASPAGRPAAPAGPGLVVGYGAPTSQDFPHAVRALLDGLADAGI